MMMMMRIIYNIMHNIVYCSTLYTETMIIVISVSGFACIIIIIIIVIGAIIIACICVR